MKADAKLNALLKQQAEEHKHLLDNHNKEMQTLRDSLTVAKEKFESISERNEKDLNDFQKKMHDQICLLKERIYADEYIISEQQKTIKSLYQQLDEFHEQHASKSSIEKFKTNLQSAIQNNTNSHLETFQKYQRELDTLLHEVKEDVIQLKKYIDQQNDLLILKIESNFNLSRIDKDSVLKLMQIQGKNTFIIEKKIENIYTLIERINQKKRGEES
jgi:hypothetical protein